MTEVCKADLNVGFVAGQSNQTISGIDKLRAIPLDALIRCSTRPRCR